MTPSPRARPSLPIARPPAVWRTVLRNLRGLRRCGGGFPGPTLGRLGRRELGGDELRELGELTAYVGLEAREPGDLLARLVEPAAGVGIGALPGLLGRLLGRLAQPFRRPRRVGLELRGLLTRGRELLADLLLALLQRGRPL